MSCSTTLGFWELIIISPLILLTFLPTSKYPYVLHVPCILQTLTKHAMVCSPHTIVDHTPFSARVACEVVPKEEDKKKADKMFVERAQAEKEMAELRGRITELESHLEHIDVSGRCRNACTMISSM